MERKYIISRNIQSLGIVGGKGHSLLKMRRYGINVPDFFILTTQAFDALIDKTGISGLSTRAKAERIKHAMIPEEIRRAAAKAYGEIIKQGRVAVRSSATVEDSAAQSYAGMFKTDLFVDKRAIYKSIGNVYASLFEGNAFADGKKGPKMAVIIQKQIDSQKSGVLFVTKDYVVINAVIGQGERFVSGKEMGDTYTVKLGEKAFRPKIIIKPQKFADVGGHSMPLPLQVSYAQKLLNPEIRRLADEAVRIYNIFGSPQDIEWCIRGDDIFILQSRPITSSIPKPLFDEDSDAIPVSTGKGCGMPWHDVKHIPDKPAIIIKEEIELKDIKYLRNKNVAGIVTRYDGMLSHASILSRELGIPYITGVSDMNGLLRAKVLCIDGSTGEIRAGNRLGRMFKISHAPAATFGWVHKDIDGITYIKEGRCLVRRIGNFEIIYQNDYGTDCPKRHSSYIVLTGPNEIYSSYGLLFRSIDAGVRGIEALMKDFTRALGLHDANRLNDVYDAARQKMVNYYDAAERAYSEYKARGQARKLIEAYVNSVIAYIYFNAIRNSAFDYAEYIFGLSMSSQTRLISDMSLYSSFNDIKSGRLLLLRKRLRYILDDISKVACEDTTMSMMDFEEQVASELKKKLGHKVYDRVVKANFG